MAKETLTVKNFGPIDNATLDLRKVTVLIGKQASGKSVLAKLVTICKSVGIIGSENEFYISKTLFSRFVNDFLKEYGIHDFKAEGSFIRYVNADYTLTIDFSQKTIFRDFFSKKLEYLLGQLLQLGVKYHTLQEEEGIAFKNSNFELANKKKSEGEVVYERQIKAYEDLDKEIEHMVYIPTDRLVLSATYQFKSTLPYLEILHKEFENKKTFKKEFQITSLEVGFYFNAEEKKNMIRLSNGNEIDLQFTASGIQSIVPLQVLIETTNPILKHFFIIEEPELNLYPTTQKKLVEYLVEKCTKGDNRLIITTHSPYILTALNNCIQARNVLREHPEHADEVAKLVRPESQIDFEDVMAYFVADGTAKPIMNNENRLIDANALDDVSDELSETFDRLLDLEMHPA